ncbi:MAG: GNAT family N-acetyltransferase [Hyphomicrobiaceae bacterium]
MSIAPLAIEAMSDIRYVHASSVRTSTGQVLTSDEVEAFTEAVLSERYTEDLIRAMRQGQILGARIGDSLVGTAGWTVVDGPDPVARVGWVHVRPMFSDSGVGTALVAEVETLVRQAGFAVLTTASTVNAVAFFEQLGFDVTSHGVRSLGRLQMPIVFMRKRLDRVKSTA